MKSSIQGMKSIREIYREFYALELSLQEDGHILVKSLRDFRGVKLIPLLMWLRDNREHVKERLRLEGWE